MHDNVLEQLYAPFELKARQGVGGKTFKYVPSDDIIDRMNKVFKGNWSTEVFQSEVIEDSVLLRVKVTVKDPESGDMHYHEGYASQQIARFTSGPNQGKPIEIGNVYKSAMSKAIKTAVTKWGVALYLEEKGGASNPVGNPTPNPNPVVMNVPTTPVTTNTKPVVTSGPVAVPGNGQAVTTSAGPPMGMPPVSNVKPADTTNPSPNPVFTTENIVNTDDKPPVPSFADNAVGKDDGISEVQKQAISHILELNSMDYGGLAKLALQTDTVPEIDDLEYNQAIKVIQYGNNLSNAAS